MAKRLQAIPVFSGRAPRGAPRALCASSAFCCLSSGGTWPHLARGLGLPPVPLAKQQQPDDLIYHYYRWPTHPVILVCTIRFCTKHATRPSRGRLYHACGSPQAARLITGSSGEAILAFHIGRKWIGQKAMAARPRQRFVQNPGRHPQHIASSTPFHCLH